VSTALLTDLTIFILALLVGIEVIGKVPATLHTPLMSATNAIHGIVLVGAMLIGVTAHNAVGYILAFIASFFAGANVVGGYAVTGRMLKMFRRKAVSPGAASSEAVPAGAGSSGAGSSGAGSSGAGQPELESLNGHKGLRGLLGRVGRAQP
jgi:H+-translocating NAD(P) transhydrogenase subunit alpha